MRARCGGGAAAWAAGVLEAPGTQGSWRLGKKGIKCSRRVWQPVYGQYAPVFLPGESPSLTEKPSWPQSTGSQRVGHYQSNPARIDGRRFLPVAALPQGELSMKMVYCLAFEDPGGSKWAGTWTASAEGLVTFSESFFRASCSWRSEGLFGQSFSVALPVQTLRGLPCLGSFSVERCIRHLKGHPGWGPSL